MDSKELIKYFRSLGLEVHTTTKARGHLGFFLKNRIDVSKNVPPERKAATLVHEFAHYIHYRLEPDMGKNGGTLKALFGEDCDDILNELLEVTHFVDENSLCRKLHQHKFIIKEKIKALETIIKADYPKFMRSKKFKEFDKYIKKSDAKYLLSYDRVRVVKGFWSKKIYSVANLEKDFPSMPKPFVAYIRLQSCRRKQARISARINKYNKYYSKPTELFARFVEGLYINPQKVKEIAPLAFQNFIRLVETGYYKEKFGFLNI